MSNKSRLQTNNTNLQLLINKANALPDAGSSGGGGGGALETCTVALVGNLVTSGIEFIYYTDGSATFKYISFPDIGDSVSITVVKNSLIYSARGIPTNSGNIELIAMSSEYTDGTYFVFGDGTLTSN